MASGNTLCVLDATAFVQPSSNYAAWAVRNNQPHLAFDAATDESAIARGIVPANYAGGGLSVTLLWRATSATSGDVVWNVSIERQHAGGDGTDSDSFALAQAVTTTTNATAGVVVSSTVNITSGANMDSLAANELFRLRVLRDADNANDTMTGDAELLAVHVKES